jgi:tetratricopeptide (TPR) repeat protein
MAEYERIDYYREISSQIDELLNSGKEDEGYKLLDNVLKDSEKDNLAYNYFFKAELENFKNNDFDKAIEFIDKAIELINDDYLLLRSKGTYKGLNKNYKEAIKIFKKAIKINPIDFQIFLNWGACLTRLNKFEKAIEKFKMAIILHPNDYRIIYNWGVCLLMKNEHEEAIEKFKKAIEINPEYYEIYEHWGLCLQALKKHEDAIQKFEQALKINNEDYIINEHWGLSLQSLNKHEEAIKKFEEILKIKPDDYSSHYHLGLSLQALNKHEEAIKKFEDAYKCNPNVYLSLNRWGVSLLKQSKKKEAIDKFKETLKINPNDSDSLRHWGICLLEKNNIESAIEKIKEAIKVNPNDVYSYIYISYIYNKELKYNDSYEWILKALKIDETIAQDHYDFLVKNNIHLFKSIENYPDNIKSIYMNINDIIKELLKNLKIEKNDKTPVVHYTTLDVLNKLFSVDKNTGKIVENKFRLSNVVHMNDPQEGKILYEYLNVDEYEMECGDELIYLPIFLFSLVRSDKSYDNLSMWRTYGKTKQGDADGLSLSFESDNFDDEEMNPAPAMIDKEKISPKFVLYNVVYYENGEFFVNQEKVNEIKEKVEEIKKIFIELKELIAQEEKKEEMKETLQILLSPLAYLVKSKNYIHENECRLILPYDAGDPRIKREDGKMYVELEKDLKIKQITFGPKMEKAEEWGAYFKEYFSRDEVIKKHGNVIIKKSNVKFK